MEKTADQILTGMWQEYQGDVTAHIHFKLKKSGGYNAEEAADFLQETYARALVSLRCGTVVRKPRAWLKGIAALTIANAWRASSSREFPVEDPTAGGPDPDAASPEAAAEVASLRQWVRQHMHRALVAGEATDPKANLGRLKELALIYYYVDRLTVDQIQRRLSYHTPALGVEAPSRQQLNNWISRGDLLARLVAALVAADSFLAGRWLLGLLPAGALGSGDAKLARQCWIERKPWRDIAAERGCSLRQVEEDLARIAGILGGQAGPELKQRLRQAR